MRAEWTGGREVAQRDLELADGRTLHVYDTDPGDRERSVVVWHHGTPNLGPPPTPLASVAEQLGLRFLGFDRPGYGGSTAHPDRTVAGVAGDVAQVLDRLDIGAVSVMSHSGGGPYALACAALLPDRVGRAVTISSPASYGGPGFDWFAGMAEAGVTQNQAAVRGREALDSLPEDLGDFGFTPGDGSALEGRWAWFLDVVRPAQANGRAGQVDDLLASMRPWGFDLGTIAAPVLLLHGTDDRAVPVTHARWLAAQVPTARLVERSGDGHITVMDGAAQALTWLVGEAVRRE